MRVLKSYTLELLNQKFWDASVAQLVKHLTPDLSSGHDLTEFKPSPPQSGSMLMVQSLLGIPSLLLSAPHLLVHVL